MELADYYVGIISTLLLTTMSCFKIVLKIKLGSNYDLFFYLTFQLPISYLRKYTQNFQELVMSEKVRGLVICPKNKVFFIL